MERKNRNRGFTLVELLITVVILAIIVAPFLATFVMASGNNLNASEKQDAANLAEDIAEEIKGKTLAVIENDPHCSKSVDPVTNKDVYEINIPSSDLPDGIRDGFTAKATLEPANHAINEDMPTLTNMYGNNTMLLMSAFFSNDNIPGAVRRKSTIKLEYDPPGYYVQLNVEYFDGSGNSISGAGGLVSDAHYTEIPAIFAVYTSKSASDELYFENELEDDEMEVDGEIVPVKFLLSIQSVSGTNTINNSNIRIKDSGMASAVGIESYIENQMTNDTNNTNLYTDASISPSVKYKGETYKNTLVENLQSDKLYNLVVEVKYKGKSCATFASSKLNLKS